MRRTFVILALAFALTLVGGACSDRGSVAGNDDGGLDAPVVQFDANGQQDGDHQADAGAQRDAPAANHDTGTSLIQCGTGSCNVAAGEECCITGTSAACVAINTCAGFGTLDCDGPEDCYVAGEPVCCAHITTSGGGASCTGPTGCTGTSAMRLCRADTDCDVTQKCCGALAVGGISVQYCLPEAQCTSTDPTPGVPCGTSTTCYAPDACCLTLSGGTCGTAASCTQGVPMACDGPEDCQQDGGTPQVCCGNITYSGTISGGSECVTTCTKTGIIGGTLCHSNDDCVSPQTCKTIGAMGFSMRLCQ